jgi:hypothetical protein
MKKIIFIPILTLLILRINLFADCDPQKHIFAISDEDFRWLHYARIENTFDSATVFCNYGEFSIINGNERNNLHFDIVDINKYQWFQGDTVQGEDSIFLEKTRTNTFSYSPDSEISFFRELSIELPCNVEFPSDNTDNLPWYAKPFIVPRNTILDDSEWRLELRRASDKTLLHTIDSVGILRNENLIIAPHFGTDVVKMNHQRLLPSNYANIPVFLCISARRYGTTPYGMLLKLNPTHISLSSQMEYDSSNYLYKMKCGSNEIDYADSIYFDKIIQYTDSLFAVDSTISSTFIDRIFFPDSIKAAFFMNRYFDTIHVGSDPTMILYVERNQGRQRIGTYGNNNKQGSLISRIIDASENKRHYFFIPLNYLLENDEYYIEIFSLNGQKVMDIKPEDIYTTNNKSNLKFFIPNSLSNGYYMVFLKNSKGDVLVTTQMHHY